MSDPQHDNYCLIPHPRDPCVLLYKTEAGWTLPRHSETDAPQIKRAMRELLPDLDVTYLRVAYDRYQDEEREEQHIVYAMENHSPAWNPVSGGAWLSRGELREVPLAMPEHRAVLEEWFAELASGHVPEKRVPWACPGWYAGALAWIDEQLRAHAYQLSGSVEQVQMRVWSCVLRVPTTTGDLYFKAAPSSFAYEPALTTGLAQLWPAHLPTVLAVDPKRHWMLMEDAGSTLQCSEQSRDVATWEHMLDLFARMQIDSAAHQDQLLALGCPDRRLDRLPALFEELLCEPSLLLLGQEDGLSKDEYAYLRALVPEVRRLCAELANYNIPEALHHDDFHDGNIMLKNGRYIFFDWAECALAHPFYTMIIVLRWSKHVLEFDEAARLRLRDAYLAPWTCYASLERLQRAFDLTQHLGLLCRALTWRQTLSQLEEAEQWAYADSISWNLRSFLYYPRDLLLEEGN